MLAHYLAPHKAQVALLLALMLIEAAALLALPRLIAQFVDAR